MTRRGVTVTVWVVLVALVLGLLIGRQWGQHSTSTTSKPTTSTNVTTTTVALQPTSAIWPFATTPTRFATPMLAAQTFALDYLGFTNPIFEPFQRGDTRSGEVPVRTSANGAVTTILVRQVTSDESWWVIGAVSPNISITTPTALETIASPVLVKGTSTAFEAVVNLEIRQDGTLTPLARTTVMGGSMGVMGPFSKAVDYPTPRASSGAIVMYTLSPKDGSVLEASVLRVAFHK
jgi:hypothetical protein